MVRYCGQVASMSRFFVDGSQVKGGEIFVEKNQDIRHISKVLRLEPGDFLEISDSSEYEYLAEITSMDAERIVCRIRDKQSFSKEPQTQVTLYQGIPKQGKMETIIQKCVELGVSRIVPMFTARTVVTESGNFSKKLDRWRKVASEAVKQCRRGLIPEVESPIRFEELLSEIGISGAFDLVLFLYENEEQTSIKEVLRSLPKRENAYRIALLIGPEGGFSEEEAQRLKCTETSCATLGRTILRTETAGPAALAMVMYELEL